MSDDRDIVTSLASLRLSTKSGLANLVADDNAKKLLECPVCLDIAQRPIFNCETGHIICNECKKKLTECVLCKSLYTNSRNFPLESLVESAKFYCNHRHKGCTVSATAVELNTHQKECPLRPMKCHLAGWHGCKGDMHYLSDYGSHLQNTHKTNCFGPSSSLKEKNVLTDCNDSFVDDKTWRGSLLKFDNRTFVSLIRTCGPSFHIGFYLVGEKSDAAKYDVKITMEKITNNRVIKNESITTVLSIRNLEDEVQKDKPNLPFAAMVHKEFLDAIGTFTPTEGKSTFSLNWEILYEVIKL